MVHFWAKTLIPVTLVFSVSYGHIGQLANFSSSIGANARAGTAYMGEAVQLYQLYHFLTVPHVLLFSHISQIAARFRPHVLLAGWYRRDRCLGVVPS